MLTDEVFTQTCPEKICFLNPACINSDTKTEPKLSWPEIDLEKPALIILTSGSTGRPKAAVLSLANLYYNALGANSRMQLAPGDQWLLSLPLYHIGGLGIFFRCLLSGATLVVGKPSLAFEDQLHENRITHLSLVPTQLQWLLKTDAGPMLLSKLKLILLGGDAHPSCLLDKSIQLGLRVMCSYGSTEMSSQVATGKPYQENGRLIAVGRILPHREVKLADDGEILVRGKTLFLGYLEADEKPDIHGIPLIKKPFDREGWFATGDFGKWLQNEEEEALLKITGRKDTLFISGGENIHPEEIEEKLMELPGIHKAVVVPVQDLEFGARPVAFLKCLVPEFLPVEQKLKQDLSLQLAKFQIPDLFMPLEKQDSEMKPQRNALVGIAQPRYDALKKVKPLRNWLLDNPPGWKRILFYKGKQVFQIRRNEPQNYYSIYVLAHTRKQVMDFLSAMPVEELKNAPWIPQKNYKAEQNPRERYEIIRLLEDDLSLQEIEIWNPTNGNLLSKIKADTFQKKISNLIWDIRYHSGTIYHGKKAFEFGFIAPDFHPVSTTEFEQAVFQSGAWLPTWNRFYLLRCLYDIKDKKVQFLGWKVQLLKNIKTGNEHEYPIWDMEPSEELLIESILNKQKLCSALDLEKANTPAKDRERRKLFAEVFC